MSSDLLFLTLPTSRPTTQPSIALGMRRHHLGRRLWGLRIQSSNKGGEISLTP